MKIKYGLAMLSMLFVLLFSSDTVYAAQTLDSFQSSDTFQSQKEEKQALEESVDEEMQETKLLMQQFDFETLNQELEKMFPTYQLNFSEIVTNIVHGNIQLNISMILEAVKNSVFGEIGEIKKIFISILMLGIVSALFSNFSKIFENHQIADIGFYFLYMLLIMILIKTFEIGIHVASETTGNIIMFMKLLIPTFFTAVGIATGSLTALAFHQLTLFAIFAVEVVLVSLLLPLTNTYLFLAVINGVNEEERLTMLLRLFKRGIGLILKLTLGLVGGIGFLQSMVTPVIDGLKVATVQKTISMIPGIGNIADSITEVVLGSALLIKNSIGVALMVILILLCMVPLVKIALLTLLLKGSAAIMGIISDKRMTACTNQVGDASLLLFKITLTTLSLFLITIAIVITATRRGL